MVKPRLLRIALLLVEATSIPLLVLGLVYLLTGYQMLVPSVKLFPRPQQIHTDLVLRIIFATMGLIHGYSGLILLLERRIRNNTLRLIIEGIVTGLFIAIAVLILVLELIVST